MPTGFYFPHPIYGTIENGEFLNLIIRKEGTTEELTTTTNKNGQYLVDAANFTTGYTASDTAELIIAELPQYSENVTIDNGDIRLK